MLEFLGMLAAQKTFKNAFRQQSEDEFYKAHARDAFPALTWVMSLLHKLTVWRLYKPPHKTPILSPDSVTCERLSERAPDVPPDLQGNTSERSQPKRPESITP